MFLLLQGPMGSFFKKLGAGLRKQGHGTLRVNFNGGDKLHYASSHAIDFCGTLTEWPARVRQLAHEHGVTDLIVYGDCRPLHQIAIQELKLLGVRIHVFEEGYIRPNHVTLELDGVNGFSQIPKDAAFYQQHGERLAHLPPLPYAPSTGSTFPRLARHTISYYAAAGLCSLCGNRYRHYRTHRQRTYQKEGFAWGLRLVEAYFTKRLSRKLNPELLSGQQPYYLVLLQLLGDSQITHHSPYNDMYEFLDQVLIDFATNAPKDTHLIVKNHPLDNGLSRYRSFLSQKARSLGLEGRLTYIDGGHLPTLLLQAKGALMVNSTAGISAIHHKVPTRTFGTAIYAVDGLVDNRRELTDFWHAPQAPDPQLYHAFRDYVIRTTQVMGNYYTPVGVRQLVEAAIPCLLTPRPHPAQQEAHDA